MELPWLKKKNQAGGEPIERTADTTGSEHILAHIADELLSSLEKKDHAALLEALKAALYLFQEDNK